MRLPGSEVVAATNPAFAISVARTGTAIAVGRVLDRYKVGKHFKLQIAKTSFTYQRNTIRIESEAARPPIPGGETQRLRKTSSAPRRAGITRSGLPPTKLGSSARFVARAKGQRLMPTLRCTLWIERVHGDPSRD